MTFDQIKQFPITVKQQITLKKGEMFIKKSHDLVRRLAALGWTWDDTWDELFYKMTDRNS